MNIPKLFLIGFMGSGKSYWGEKWARRHHLDFSDLDAEIEKVFGMRVEEIFEKHSEEKFRELERVHLRKNENKTNLLISCGGGTPCFFDNIDWMLKNGVVVYLRATSQFILSHVIEETEKRPLLKKVNESELLFFIRKKLAEREPVYRKAHYTLDTIQLDEGSLDEIIHDLDVRDQAV